MYKVAQLVVAIVVSSLLLACASTEVADDSEGRIYWPKPPVQPRFVYEATLRDEDSLKPLSQTERMRLSLTGYRTKKDIFAKPFGVAAYNGSVVVTDTVQRRGFIFNFWRQKVFAFGVAGSEGALIKPMGVAMDHNQNIYVADVGARQIRVYDSVGMYLRSVGSPDELDRPVGVAVSGDGGKIYIIDAGGIDSSRHRLMIYGADDKAPTVVGRRGTGDGEFNLPTHIALAPDGTVYVLDAGNFRIQAFTSDGEFLRSWGKVGRDFGDLARPRGLAVDGAGDVYVTDTAYRNFQVFSPEGQLLLAVGGEGLEDRPGQFALPAGIAIDEKGYVYVVDQLFMKVDVFRRLSESEAHNIMRDDPEYRQK